jgi:hypothetical protein
MSGIRTEQRFKQVPDWTHDEQGKPLAYVAAGPWSGGGGGGAGEEALGGAVAGWRWRGAVARRELTRVASLCLLRGLVCVD